MKDHNISSVLFSALLFAFTGSQSLVFSQTPTADAAVISVNFTDCAEIEQIDPGTAAGIGGHPNWNNTILTRGTFNSLKDSNGNVTGASIDWASYNTWRDATAHADAVKGLGDARLAFGYLDDGRTDLNRPPCSWTVTGIGYETYDVILYLATDVYGDVYGPVSVNGAEYSTQGPKHTYTNPNWDAGNTIKVSGLSGDLTVQGRQRLSMTDPIRASIAGFQIVQTGELLTHTAPVIHAKSFGVLSYKIDGDSITITDCDAAAAQVVVPAMIEGKPVTAIEDRAFAFCTSMTNIVLPDGIIKIGEGAFAGCRSLPEIRLPGSITRLGREAFKGCKLNIIKIPSVESDIDGAVPGKWTMDFDAAKQLAAEKRMPILLDFSGSDWCHWCKVMEENVFTKPEWKEYAQSNLVMVLIDFPSDKSLVPKKYAERNEALKAEYSVRGYPTFVVLDDDGKTELGRLGSGRDKTPESFREELEELLRFRSVEVEKYLASLSPEDQAAYRGLIEKLTGLKLDVKLGEKEQSEILKKVRALKGDLSKLEKEMLEFRVAHLDEAGHQQFEGLEKQLEDARKQLTDWFKSKPEENEENMAKYKAMTTEIKEIEQKISQY